MVEINSQKVSKFTQFSMKLRHKWAVFKENFKKSDDVKATGKFIFDIALYGILSDLALTLFGVPFGIAPILASGSFLWLLINKLIPEMIKLLNSFRLVQVR